MRCGEDPALGHEGSPARDGPAAREKGFVDGPEADDPGEFIWRGLVAVKDLRLAPRRGRRLLLAAIWRQEYADFYFGADYVPISAEKKTLLTRVLHGAKLVFFPLVSKAIFSLLQVSSHVTVHWKPQLVECLRVLKNAIWMRSTSVVSTETETAPQYLY